jgi:hypothetical protein
MQKSVEDMLAEFDKVNPTPKTPYVDFLANRKRILPGGQTEEYQDIFRADGTVACYATRAGLDTKANKGWQILRYGNFDAFLDGEGDSEEVAQMRELCESHINIRNQVVAQMKAQTGIKAKLDAATEKKAETKENVAK